MHKWTLTLLYSRKHGSHNPRSKNLRWFQSSRSYDPRRVTSTRILNPVEKLSLNASTPLLQPSSTSLFASSVASYWTPDWTSPELCWSFSLHSKGPTQNSLVCLLKLLDMSFGSGFKGIMGRGVFLLLRITPLLRFVNIIVFKKFLILRIAF